MRQDENDVEDDNNSDDTNNSLGPEDDEQFASLIQGHFSVERL